VNTTAAIDALPIAALAGIGILIAIQLALQVIAIIQLVRTPAERVRIGGRKWVWALIILLGEIVGPLVWFFAGRKPVEIDVAAGAVARDTARSAVDDLYGDSETKDR
jgi:hypothetical protein